MYVSRKTNHNTHIQKMCGGWENKTELYSADLKSEKGDETGKRSKEVMERRETAYIKQKEVMACGQGGESDLQATRFSPTIL